MSNNRIGARGEAIAADHLKGEGYRILARNYRYDRAEVDLVCFDPADAPAVGGDIVFVEVKTRSGLEFGAPEEAVTDEKQTNVIRAAEAYLYEHRMTEAAARFDVVSVLLNRDGPPTIRHFEDAFWAE